MDGKAELVNGGIVPMSPTGLFPGYASGEIDASLRAYVRRVRKGIAVPDNIGFRVNLPNRKSFSPDAAYYTGSYRGTKFAPDAPVFAVEICSPEDYGVVAEREMAAKRADYLASGTLVVWDVDLTRGRAIAVYTTASPQLPTVYKRGQATDAEPAVPGWTMLVDDLYPEWYDDSLQTEESGD